MADVDEIIYYIKSLKRGFDKDLYNNKISELAYAVDTTGLHYNDFHTLVKVWLNLSIPITKWVNLGTCLVPQDCVEERTVEYTLCWILDNYENQSALSRIGFLLDWLTAAMECNCIDMTSLDLGYDVFFIALTYENLTPHALKLVYTLTKPVDVTRRRVLELLDYAKKREAKKNMFRQLLVLLGLFKSYKPECVPEDIPAISIHTSFKKLNPNLLMRFQRNQERRNSSTKERHHLMWTNPINSGRGRNKKVDPLVPNMEFNSIDTKHSDKGLQKNCLDFAELMSLVPYSVAQCGSRPARLRALLCNASGAALLAVASRAEHAFLSHDLHHLLNTCFLDISPYSYVEKQDLLYRLAALQNTLIQGIPVITRFLAQYLPLWNERDYFAEILELVEWLSVDSPDHVTRIVQTLSRIYQRAQPMEQCAILKSLTNMYSNLVYSRTRSVQHFMGTNPSPSSYSLVLPKVATAIRDMCTKGLQVNPDDMRILYSSVWSAECMCWSEVRYGTEFTITPSPLVLSLPLLSISATIIDKMALLIMLYKQIVKRISLSNIHQEEDKQVELKQTLQAYTADIVNCLYMEEALSSRKTGRVFEKLHPQLVHKLGCLIPNVDSIFSLRNHLAFAPYACIKLNAIDDRDADNKLWFNMVIDQEFEKLSKFLKKVLPDLRCK